MSDDSELVERVANALERNFKEVVAYSAGMSFEKMKVELPARAIWLRYALTAVAEVQRFLDLPPTKGEMELRLELSRTQAEVVHTQDELGNLLHAAEAKLAEVQRWRPIEEAPRIEGRRLWLWQRGRGGYEGWWNDFGSEGQDWQDDSDSEPAPTNWQPLPAPPQ